MLMHQKIIFKIIFQRGADDLLPILHYILIRTESPQLVSECLAIEELVHEGWVESNFSILWSFFLY